MQMQKISRCCNNYQQHSSEKPIYKSVINLHVSGSLIDHVFIMSTSIVELFTNATAENFFIGP